jgi:16S rRNA (guanine527-N7)-methyltransferase
MPVNMEITATTSLDYLRPLLIQGMAELGLPIQKQSTLVKPLLDFLTLLSKWNQAYNLTSLRNPEDMLSLHLLDCLATIFPIEEYLGGTPTQLIDVGSGGGLPGIIFALAWPTSEHHLIDTVGKKVAFLQQCKLQLKLKQLQAHHGRIETFELNAPDPRRVFTCRAFASLSDFLGQTWHLRQDRSVWIALKGHMPNEELNALKLMAEQKLKTTLSIQVKEIHPPGLSESKRHLIFFEAATILEKTVLSRVQATP